MKNIVIFLSFLAFIVTFNSCESSLEKVTMKSTVEPLIMTDLTASTYTLLADDAEATFQTFTWTEADYGFPANISYTVQIDKKTNNFSAPYDVVTVSNTDQVIVTVGDFNKAMLNAGFEPNAVGDVQFRIKSSVNPTVVPVNSDVKEATVTPYPLIFPPIFMTGEATGGWNWNQYVYKELRSSSPSIYSTIGYFLNGKAFRFFKQADWGPESYNYPYFTTVSNLFVNANDGDKNFQVAGATGYYKVTVNLKTKTVTTEAVPDQVLFMTGAALGGWDWSTNYVQLTWKSNGIYQATTDFAVETFRFFAQKDWGPTSYNYPYFAAGTVSTMFVNANDGDKNFRFVGTPGSYTITVNMLDLIVTMQ